MMHRKVICFSPCPKDSLWTVAGNGSRSPKNAHRLRLLPDYPLDMGFRGLHTARRRSIVLETYPTRSSLKRAQNGAPAHAQRLCGFAPTQPAVQQLGTDIRSVLGEIRRRGATRASDMPTFTTCPCHTSANAFRQNSAFELRVSGGDVI